MTEILEDWQQRDCDALAALHQGEDPRSLNEMIAEDHYEEIVIERAKRGKDGYTTISWDHGITTSVKGPPIKVGDRVRFYGGAHLGDVHHGWALNGEVIEWQTPWERFAERIAMLARHDRARRERAEKDREHISAWLTELRGPYRERIERLRRQKTTFDLDGGTYETYPVLMAQRIEDWVHERHPDAAPAGWEDAVALVKELEAKPYNQQAKILHGGHEDEYGVSGHQVDSAFGMAAAVLCGSSI